MRSAPSVIYPVGRSRFGAMVLLATWSAALVVFLAWLLVGPSLGGRQAAGAAVLVACGLWAWRSHRAAPCGQLAWDGAAWQWDGQSSASRPVAIEVMVDLQAILLLRMQEPGHASGRTEWLWVGQDADTLRWQALRRAVYFRAGQQAQPEAAPVKP
jgi:toxin CptA